MSSRLRRGPVPRPAAPPWPRLFAAIPFIAAGHVGILGVGLVNDDMASHLLLADWIHEGFRPEPVLVDQGYPLGPHALVAGLGDLLGARSIDVFAGLTLAIPALTALVAFAALDGLRTGRRVGAAALVALPYMAAAYLAQEAFKEPIIALFLLAFALLLPAVRGWRDAIPLGVLAAGTVYVYSFPGLAWLAGVAVVWGAIELVRGAAARGRSAWPIAAASRPCVLAAPGARPISTGCATSSTSAPWIPTAPTRAGSATCRGQLSPLEALGIWPTSEFRLSAARELVPAVVFYAGALLAAVALRPRPAALAAPPRLGDPRRAARRRPALPRRPRLRHRLHLGQGARDRRAADRPDRARRPAAAPTRRRRAAARPARRCFAARRRLLELPGPAPGAGRPRGARRRAGRDPARWSRARSCSSSAATTSSSTSCAARSRSPHVRNFYDPYFVEPNFELENVGSKFDFDSVDARDPGPVPLRADDASRLRERRAARLRARAPRPTAICSGSAASRPRGPAARGDDAAAGPRRRLRADREPRSSASARRRCVAADWSAATIEGGELADDRARARRRGAGSSRCSTTRPAR